MSTREELDIEIGSLVATAYSNYVAACLAIDDRRDAAKAKREGLCGSEQGVDRNGV